MARYLIRPLRETVVRLLQPPKIARIANSTSTRNYVSEMRKEAFEGKILRLLRNEIQYEIDRAPPAEVIILPIRNFYFNFNFFLLL